jgi:TonB family protein
MTAAALSFRSNPLPWTAASVDELRFRTIRQRVLGLALLLCLMLAWLPVVDPPAPPQPAPPARIAKLVLPPLPPRPAAAPPKAAEPQVRPPLPQAEVARPRPAAVAAARQPVPDKRPGEALETARRQAAGVGLMAMKDQLSQLSGAPVAVQLQAELKPGAGIGSGSGPGVGAGTQQGLPTRAMITSTAARGSGGIASGNVSRDTGGGGLAGRATTLVEGSIGGGGGGGPGGGAGGGSAVRGDGSGTSAAAGGSVKRAGSGKASRSIEEIRLVFERHKGAIYALYNRALRDEPALQGKVVLELKIAPGGEVVDCRVISSELAAAELERKLLARIRQFDFGAKDVETMVVSWPVDFLPS